MSIPLQFASLYDGQEVFVWLPYFKITGVESNLDMGLSAQLFALTSLDAVARANRMPILTMSIVCDRS